VERANLSGDPRQPPDRKRIVEAPTGGIRGLPAKPEFGDASVALVRGRGAKRVGVRVAATLLWHCFAVGMDAGNDAAKHQATRATLAAMGQCTGLGVRLPSN
jgi:hypothetical protein